MSGLKDTDYDEFNAIILRKRDGFCNCHSENSHFKEKIAYEQLFKAIGSKRFSTEEVKDHARIWKVCPYHYLRYVFKNKHPDLILLPYQYLINP